MFRNGLQTFYFQEQQSAFSRVLMDLTLRHLLVCPRDLLSLVSYSISTCKISTKIFDVRSVEFADDGTIWMQGTDTKVLSKTIEQEFQKIFKLTLNLRMKLSPEKNCLFFQRKPHH